MFSTYPILATMPIPLLPRRDPVDVGEWADPPECFAAMSARWIKACNDAWLVATGRVKPRPALALVRS